MNNLLFVFFQEILMGMLDEQVMKELYPYLKGEEDTMICEDRYKHLN